MAYGNNNGGYNRYQARSPQNAAPRNSGPRGQNQPKQVTSTGPTLYNEGAGKFLNFNYWGRYSSVEIGVCPIGAPLNWDTRKNAQKVTQVISFSDLSELQDICEEVIESVKNTGTFTPTAVKVGSKQDCMVEINNGSTINMSPGIYLVIYKNLDSAGRTNNLEFYPFTSCKMIRGYDHNSGSGKEDISKIGEFKKFYRMVKESAKAFTMAQAHAISVSGETDRLTCFKALSAITASLGIDMSAELRDIRSGGGGFSRGGQSGGGSYGGRNGSYTPSRSAPRSSTFESGNAGGGFPSPQQVMSTMDDPVDISLSMDNLTNVDMSKFS